MLNNDNIHEIIGAWRIFLQTKNWQHLIQGHQPHISGCGIIYDLPNFLNRENEGFAIVDMRHISFAEPHYHPENVYEFYFVMQGSAKVYFGNNMFEVKTGDVVTIPPNMVHYTIPDKQFVLAVVNTPPFKPEHYIKIDESHNISDFDHEKFQKQTKIR